MRRKWKPLLLILSLLVNIIGISGLGCSDYRTFTLREGIAHLSFQYPSRYELDSVNLGNIYLGASTDIFFFTAPLKAPDLHDAMIEIYVSNPYEKWSNSDESIASYLSFWSRDEGFQLMERSSVTVAGVQGTQIVYYRTSHLAEPTNPGIPMVRTPVIVRKVFFDYKNQIWRISVMGHESLADIINADFEHIVQTFKILN